MSSSPPLLALKDVHTHIGGSHILQGVTFDVPAGQTTVLLGRNGAGKSTTLRTILGLWKAERGSIRLNGEELIGRPAHRVTREGIAFVPEDREVFASLTVDENLRLAWRRQRGPELPPSNDEGGPLGTAREADLGEREQTDRTSPPPPPVPVPSAKDGERSPAIRVPIRWLRSRLGPADREGINRVYRMFPDLHRARKRSAGAMSGGQQQMLAIGRALVNPSQILLIDEPTKGLAPVIVQQLAQSLRSLQQRGQTILLVEQNLEFARSIGERYFILDEGRVVHAGLMAELTEQPEALRRYIGV
ncbi:MAG TPA: ABC transporter ATP-binding protein [Chloroflexota bacterium]|jgi:branched-chain amino acid transport system ATP-binding protein|nr:ABC transporter ATP-binding protein [Chloroflexota bacterium]